MLACYFSCKFTSIELGFPLHSFLMYVHLAWHVLKIKNKSGRKKKKKKKKRKWKLKERARERE